MLDTVVVQSATPLTLNLTNVDPLEMFILKSISGLTSSKVGLFTGDYASEGSYYQGRRPDRLTPVFTIKMNPDYTDDVDLSDLRDRLYRAFYQPLPGSHGVKVVLKDDRRPDRYFVGYTEHVNTDQFSKSRDIQVSMVCMDPNLYSDALSVGSDPVGWGSLPITYDGSAQTGIKVVLKVNTATSVVTFELNGNKMILNRSFSVGEVITIDTRKGTRCIKIGALDVMATLDPTSTWVKLDREANTMKAYGSVSGDGKAVITSYEYRSEWWGL